MLESAAEDFSRKTLAAVPGILNKLDYLSGLRLGDGGYTHWGMARIHGEAAASQAIAQAHTGVFLLLLRAPVSSLWDELQGMAAERSEGVQACVETLTAHGERLVPAHLEGGGRRHFRSVLAALSSLAKTAER